jgi:hypothetical protein
MQNAIVIKGRLVGPQSVELDEPVFDFLRRLPAGTRGREDIDHQIREEREAWGKEA